MYINTIRVLSWLQRGRGEIICIISPSITVDSKETTNFPEGKKWFCAVVVLLKICLYEEFSLTHQEIVCNPPRFSSELSCSKYWYKHGVSVSYEWTPSQSCASEFVSYLHHVYTEYSNTEFCKLQYYKPCKTVFNISSTSDKITHWIFDGCC